MLYLGCFILVGSVCHKDAEKIIKDDRGKRGQPGKIQWYQLQWCHTLLNGQNPWKGFKSLWIEVSRVCSAFEELSESGEKVYHSNHKRSKIMMTFRSFHKILPKIDTCRPIFKTILKFKTVSELKKEFTEYTLVWIEEKTLLPSNFFRLLTLLF